MSDAHRMTGSLLSLVQEAQISSVAIVGMAKNTGKTVTLNQLVREATDAGVVLGITSVGRDGEERDEVFHTPKPRIFVPQGAFVATARGTLKRCESGMEIVQSTGFSSAMGEIVIGRTCRAGYVEVAGATLINQQRQIRHQLRQLGAELVIVDGALGRMSSAVPSLVEGTILASGAAMGGSMEDVLQKTRDRVERLSLPQVEASVLPPCQHLMGERKVALIDDAGVVEILPAAGSFVAGEILAAYILPTTRVLVVGGAVGNGVLDALLGSKDRWQKLCLVIRNGTCLFSDRLLWQKFQQAGGVIRVVEPIRLLGITVNPAPPLGERFDAAAFLAASIRGLAPYPVIDVMQQSTLQGCN